MNKIKAVQLFSIIAIAVGVAISYYPPLHNSEAIWALISGFLGYASRDLFASSQPTTTEQQP
jgi:hypothetical protein